MRKGSQMLVSGIPLQEASQADAFKRRPFGTSIDQYTKEIIGGNALSFPSKWWFALRQVDLQVWKLTFPFTHLSGFTFVGIGGPPSQSSLAPSPLPNEGLPPPFPEWGDGTSVSFFGLLVPRNLIRLSPECHFQVIQTVSFSLHAFECLLLSYKDR